jgi:hypothetical protein
MRIINGVSEIDLKVFVTGGDRIPLCIAGLVLLNFRASTSSFIEPSDQVHKLAQIVVG